jgi:ATP-binding cassette subfamily B protein
LKQPRILLLDEATSALDEKNEKAVQDAIDRYRKTYGNITIIVIAHRLTTIEKCDFIYELNNGRVINSGKPTELLHKDKN